MNYLEFYKSLQEKINENAVISDKDKVTIKVAILEALSDILKSELKIKSYAKNELDYLLANTLASLEIANKEPKKENQN